MNSVHKIHRLLDLNWEKKICHSYREANSCIKALTNIDSDCGYALIIYKQIRAQISLSFMINSFLWALTLFVSKNNKNKNN